jgi:hypothetical protein
MSDDSDFPYLEADRRNFRKQVGVSVLAVVIGLGIVVAKCSRVLQERRDVHAQIALNRALQDMPPTGIPTVPATGGDEPAIDLELVRDSSHADLVGSSIALGDGRTLEVRARPQWTYSGKDMSLRYASTMRVTADADGLLLGGNEALGEIAIVPTALSEAEGVAEMARVYESTGQVAASEATTMKLLGREVAGKRIHTVGPAAEVVAVSAGKGKQMRVIITATSPGADPSDVRDAVQTITLKRLPATADFDVTLHGTDGATIASAEATIGTPFELGGERMTIAWRKTVQQHRNGMRFEHPPGLTVTNIEGAAPTVALRSGEIGIQVMLAPFAIAPEEMSDALGASSVPDATLISHTFGNKIYRGVAGEFTMGELAMHTQAFTFERGGRPFIVMIQSPTAQADLAAKLAEPVVVSVQ